MDCELCDATPYYYFECRVIDGPEVGQLYLCVDCVEKLKREIDEQQG